MVVETGAQLQFQPLTITVIPHIFSLPFLFTQGINPVTKLPFHPYSVFSKNLRRIKNPLTAYTARGPKYINMFYYETYNPKTDSITPTTEPAIPPTTPPIILPGIPNNLPPSSLPASTPSIILSITLSNKSFLVFSL